MAVADPAPLILTLAMDEGSFTFFDDMRRRHFPASRNVIPAHLTLFHALPGVELAAVERDLVEICRAQPPLDIRVTGLRSLGRGVAYVLESAVLSRLHAALAGRWATWLTPQDRQTLRPHVTVQNKVDPDTARELLRALETTFEPFSVQGEGLQLWRYRGGPWDPVRRFPFAPQA